MTRYPIEPKTRKYVKGYRFLSFASNLSDKHGIERSAYWKNSKNKKIQQTSIDIFLNETMLALADCLFSFIQNKTTMTEGISSTALFSKRYFKKLSSIPSSSMKRTLVTNQLILK